MTFDARVVRVLIASPGDTGAARSLLRTVMEDWNSLHAEDTSVMLLPVVWERDATPEMGDRPQALINRQIVDAADVLVGTFWTRLGTPTGAAASGTVEEIERFIAAEKPVLLYFSNEPVVLDSVDQDEYARLREFRDSLKDRGLFDTYGSEAELWRKANAGLTRVMREHFRLAVEATGAGESLPRGPRAGLLARVEREREIAGFSSGGRPRYRSREHFVVENRGTAAADDLTFTFEAAAGAAGDVPEVYTESESVTRLPVGGQLIYPLLLHMGSASQWDVIFSWKEDDQPYQDRQTVRA